MSRIFYRCETQFVSATAHVNLDVILYQSSNMYARPMWGDKSYTQLFPHPLFFTQNSNQIQIDWDKL